MSMSHETRSAKSGNTPTDRFDPGRSFVTLTGVGRMQNRGIVTVLFDLKDDNKTVPFVTVMRSGDGCKYVVDGVRFDGRGDVIPRPTPAIETVAKKAKPKKAKPEKTEPNPLSDVQLEATVDPGPSEPEVTEAAMGL